MIILTWHKVTLICDRQKFAQLNEIKSNERSVVFKYSKTSKFIYKYNTLVDSDNLLVSITIITNRQQNFVIFENISSNFDIVFFSCTFAIIFIWLA